MIHVLAWASLLVFIFLSVCAALPEWTKQMEDEGHLKRRTPKQKLDDPLPDNVIPLKGKSK